MLLMRDKAAIDGCRASWQRDLNRFLSFAPIATVGGPPALEAGGDPVARERPRSSCESSKEWRCEGSGA